MIEDMDGAVLIVDDDKHIRQLYRYFLKDQFKGQILTAANGEEAIEYCQKYQPVLVFMDIHMPEKDGITTINELRSVEFVNPIVIVTASDTRIEDWNGLDYTALLQKPISRMKLIEHLALTKRKAI